VAETCQGLPFGDELNCSGGDVSPLHFTGKERDVESNLDDFGKRYFGSSLGRFTSPDSIANDWELVNPQTWNRYVYVRNSPLVYVDPNGAALELKCIGATSADACSAQRQKELSEFQKDVGNKEAASRLYINVVRDGSHTRYFLGIKGDVGSFMRLGKTAHDLANLVEDKQIVEFGLTNKDISAFGGAVTYARGEVGNQNVRVLVNPNEMGVADRALSPNTILGAQRWAGQNQYPRWAVQPFTPGIAEWHEFGHSWGYIHGRVGGASNSEALRWENRMREQVYGPSGPDNAPRIVH
jgi:RHS repeat-associated protein